MVSFYISRSGKAAVDHLAADVGRTKADIYRELLQLGMTRVAEHPDAFRHVMTSRGRGSTKTEKL